MPDTLKTLIAAVDAADSSARLLEAVQDLANAADVGAVPTLIAALSYNNPGAAVAAVDGLIKIGEPAVPALLDQLDRHNYTARAWAIRALAGIGDPRGLTTLLGAATADFAMSVRRAAARGLGTLKWPQFPADELEMAQAEALDALLFVCDDEEWVVRYAAVTNNLVFRYDDRRTRPSSCDADTPGRECNSGLRRISGCGYNRPTCSRRRERGKDNETNRSGPLPCREG
nr:HEAT repeat domain-containing protein [Leptolyngbya sp. 7M]